MNKPKETSFETFSTDDWGASDWDSDGSSFNTTTTNELEELLKMRDLSLESKTEAKNQNESKQTKNKEEKKEEEIQNIEECNQIEKEEEEKEYDQSIPACWLSVADEPPLKKPKYKKLHYDDFEDNKEWAGEKYERNTHFTKKFSKFLKYVERSPQQIIRYCIEGEPIWVSDRSEEPKIPICSFCNQRRVFELQLMPHGLNWVINSLAKSQKSKIKLAGIGSVFIFSCICCTIENVVQEVVVIQGTEDNIGPLKG